jgi:hypothetical protein
MPGTQYYFRVRSKDAARNEAVSDGSSFKTYLQLKPGPYKVEAIGPLVYQATMSRNAMFRHPKTGEMHFIQLYCLYGQLSTQKFQIVDINMDTGQTRVVDGGYGRPDPCYMVLHPNGKVYIGSQGPAYLTAYDPVSGTAEIIGRASDVCIQGLSIGADMRIYMAEAVKGYVEAYDPSTGQWSNYGIMDDPGSNYYRYVYTMASDGVYLYCAIRDQTVAVRNGTEGFYLVIHKLATGEERVFWKDETNTGYMNVGVNTEKKCWIASKGLKQADGNTVYVNYKLDGFNDPELITDQTTPSSIPPPKNIPTIVNEGGWDWRLGYQMDLSDAVVFSTSPSDGTAIFHWKANGEQNWHHASVQGIRTEAVPIKLLLPISSTNLALFAENYGPIVLYDPTSGNANILGVPNISFYDRLLAKDGKVYIAGYPSVLAVWDPSRDWNLPFGASDLYAATLNPRRIRYTQDGYAKYYYYIAEDAYGTIYFGGHHERDSIGGSLAWYNPKTGEIGGLRTPFLEQDVRDVVPAMGGEVIVYSSVPVQEGAEGKLFVIDAKTKQVIKVIDPPEVSGHTGQLIEAEYGTVIGGTGGLLYKVDLRTGETLWVRQTSGTLYGGLGGVSYRSQRRLIRGPDGYIWAYMGSDIYRFDPKNGDSEKIVTPGIVGRICFDSNGELWIFGNGMTRIYRVRGLF